MWKVWFRNYLFFKKTFLVSLFWTVLEPLMYLGALGFGFGRYISSIEGISFVEFYYAGLLCTTAMLVSYFESTYPNYTKMIYQKTYSTMLLAPLDERDILYGEILWGATKGFIGTVGVFIISSLFGLFNTQVLLVIPVIILLSLIFSAFGMIMISVAKNYDTFIFSTSGIVVPLTLISGTYFSLKQMPALVQLLAYIFPLSHAVELTRAILYKKMSTSDLIHFAVLIIYLVVLTFIARKVFAKKLIS